MVERRIVAPVVVGSSPITHPNMKFIAISGGWRKTNPEIERIIRKEVKEIISRGDGIISGGALGVDYIATDEALRLHCSPKQLKVIIPSTLEIYKNHYFNRAGEGVITEDQAKYLIEQLEKVKVLGSLIEGPDLILDKETYFRRITEIVAQADELLAFHINKTEGTQDSITKAKAKGIPVKVFEYSL